MKTFILILCFPLLCLSSISQNNLPSVGPAPFVYNNTQQSPVFDAMIGTRYFTQISSTPTFQFGKAFLETCTITNIGAPFTITYPGGLMYRNGTIYTWNQNSPYQLWYIDTITGVHTLVFNVTGVPLTNFTGLTWDGSYVYGVATNVTQSQIFTVNMTTGVCTPIGAPSIVCPGAISISSRKDYRLGLFVIDIVGDNLYRANRTTGAFTLVGSLGVDANFGQDAQFDNNDGKLYWMAYTTGPELRRIDTATGSASVLLCTYPAQGTGIAVKDITYYPIPGAQVTACRSGLNKQILDHSTLYDSLFSPVGDDCYVVDVNVRIDSVLHTWDSDLSFYLQRNNIGVKIIDKVGSSGDNFIGTILNDSASTPIASGVAPFTGTYQPSNSLTALNGNLGINGRYWRLLITDTVTGDTGVLSKWCLVITYTCPVGGIQTIEIPNYYFLEQNYPNPFNPVTNIRYQIPNSKTIVKIAVYDILGREVLTLFNGVQDAGEYKIDFNAANYASGVYFYRIEAEEPGGNKFVDSKKMVLLK